VTKLTSIWNTTPEAHSEEHGRLLPRGRQGKDGGRSPIVCAVGYEFACGETSLAILYQGRFIHNPSASLLAAALQLTAES
jgi:hypothetical protein